MEDIKKTVTKKFRRSSQRVRKKESEWHKITEIRKGKDFQRQRSQEQVVNCQYGRAGKVSPGLKSLYHYI